MNIIEALDILPQLVDEDPKAALVYSTAKQFCDKKGRLTVKLKMIGDHLGLSPQQLKEKCRILKKRSLIAKDGSGVVLPEQRTFISSSPQTDLRQFALEGIPQGFEALLDEKQMYDCYTTLGTQLWKVLAQVANYFRVDYPTLVRLMYNPHFKQGFLAVRKKVEQAAEITGQKVTRRRKKKQPSKPIPELVKQLIEEVHIRNGIEIPRSEWKSPQLLRVFVLMYKKRYQEDYHFTTNPFSSLEMREIKKITSAFGDDPTVTIEFLKWCFTVKSLEKAVINPLRIRFCSSDNVIREFMRLKEQGQLNKGSATVETPARSDVLPTEFIEWIVASHGEMQQIYHFSKREDLVWLKEAYNSDELPDERLKPILEEAIQRNLI